MPIYCCKKLSAPITLILRELLSCINLCSLLMYVLVCVCVCVQKEADPRACNLLKVDFASVFERDMPCPLSYYHGTVLFGHPDILKALGPKFVSPGPAVAPPGVFSYSAEAGAVGSGAGGSSSVASSLSAPAFPVIPRFQHMLYSLTATVLFRNALPVMRQVELEQQCRANPEKILAFWERYRQSSDTVNQVFHLAAQSKYSELGVALVKHFVNEDGSPDA